MKIKINELKNNLILNTDTFDKILCYKEKLEKGESVEIYVYKKIYQ